MTGLEPAQIKRQLVEQGAEDRVRYRSGKTPFIESASATGVENVARAPSQGHERPRGPRDK